MNAVVCERFSWLLPRILAVMKMWDFSRISAGGLILWRVVSSLMFRRVFINLPLSAASILLPMIVKRFELSLMRLKYSARWIGVFRITASP